MKRLKRNIRVILAAVLVLFGSLGAYFFYAVYAYGGRWFTTPYNTRLRSAKNTVIAGDILDRTGMVLAASDTEGNRVYPTDSATRKAVSHVIGDTEGQVPTGAETFLTADLLGFNANLMDRISQLFSAKRRGSDVKLTLDAQLQTYIAKNFPDGKHGAVALINYKTGEVYALYSNPEFDAKHPEKALEDEAAGALLNRATQGRYAPGSIFKIVTMACALEHIPGVTQRSFSCTGQMQVTEEIALTDTEGQGHGELTMEEAFTKSCNIAFGQLALELGEEKLRRTAQNMGFDGNFLFSDLIVYESQFPQGPIEKGELAWTGVGQGKLMVSPLHMAMIAGAVAGGGAMMTPQLVYSVIDNLGGEHSSLHASVCLQAMPSGVAATLQDYMRLTVTSGTATRAAVDGVTIGGKTGTAQVNSSGGKYEPHSWYVGFCDEEDAPYAIAVVVENGGAGSGAAARLASKAIKKAIALLSEQ